MSLQRPSLEEIYTHITTDMQARVSSNTKILRFSLLGILATVFAGAVHLIYGFAENIALQIFPDTATGIYLERIANIYNLPRKSATFATGVVQFTGIDSTVIPEGTQVQTEDGQIYSTLAETTVTAGQATASIQSDIEGATGNNSAVQMQLVAPLAGVETTVSVTEQPSGGQDAETDEELRERILQRIQKPPASGTTADYERWATEVPGVGKAWALPAEEYGGAGTVGVVIATADLTVIDPAVKAQTQSYIDSVRSAGLRTDVIDIIPKETTLNISITPNTQEIRDNITNSLQELFLAESTPGGTLLLSHIRSAVSVTGVIDYEITDIVLESQSIGVVNIETAGVDTAVFLEFNASEL